MPVFDTTSFYTDSDAKDTVLSGILADAAGELFLALRFFRKGDVLYYVVSQHDDPKAIQGSLFFNERFTLDHLLDDSKGQYLVGLDTKTKAIVGTLEMTRQQILELEYKHQTLRAS